MIAKLIRLFGRKSKTQNNIPTEPKRKREREDKMGWMQRDGRGEGGYGENGRGGEGGGGFGGRGGGYRGGRGGFRKHGGFRGGRGRGDGYYGECKGEETSRGRFTIEGLQVTPNMYDSLKEIATAQGISFYQVCRDAFKKYIADYNGESDETAANVRTPKAEGDGEFKPSEGDAGSDDDTEVERGL